MPNRKGRLQRRIDQLTREKHELLRTIEQLLRELKEKGRQPSTLTARKEHLMHQNHTIRRPVSPRTTTAVLHKQFYQRLSKLSDADQGKLSIAIIERFLRLNGRGKQI